MVDITDIKALIDADSTSKRKLQAKIGQRYYDAEHDIKDYRLFYYNTDSQLVEDKTRSNERICHPFFTELVDQATAFILSNTEDIITSKDEQLQEHLNRYFDDEFWFEAAGLVDDIQIKGFGYLYAYMAAEDRTVFQCPDSLGVIEVRGKDAKDGKPSVLYWYVDRIENDTKEIIKVQQHTEDAIYFYVQDGESGEIRLDPEEPDNPKPNVIYQDDKGQKYGRTGGLGYIPFKRLDYNRKQTSALKPIKALIDDYDLMECGLSNNLQDFDTPVHVVKGFPGDDLDELQQNIKTKKVVGVDEQGGIDVLTVDVPYQARKTKADEDEKNIYRFGFGINTQSLKDTNATTNIAIKMAYTLLELKAKRIINRFTGYLRKEIIPIVLDEINRKENKGWSLQDVTIKFKPEIVVNETENIQNERTKAETQQIQLNTILSAAAHIGDDETLRAICDVLDIDFEEIKDKVEEQNPQPLPTGDARNILADTGDDGGIDGGIDGSINAGAVKTETEEEVGKPLNGAQTTSLLNIISQYKAGQLTADEAVSILAISIGITEAKARKILQLPAVEA